MKAHLRLASLIVLVILVAACSAPADEPLAPTPIPTYAPYVAPVATATKIPAATATEAPTQAPTAVPTEAATAAPTATPTEAATESPSEAPTEAPTESPTEAPTETPTVIPTATPEATATPIPTETPAPTATPEAVSAATTLAELTPAQISAGLPADFAVLLATADAARGQTLTVSNGCIACHSLEKDVHIVGPSWFDVGDHAVTRVPGEGPALYLYTSVMEPNAFVNEGYPAMVMPMIYADTIPQTDLADIVAYLLSLSGE